MVVREHRLKKNKHYQFIYKHGTAKQNRFLTVVSVPTKIKPFKVGFSVSKKIGKSVVRNKVRRRLKECFAQLCEHFNNDFNYIFVAKSGIEEIDFYDLKQEMAKILKKANLWIE